MQTYFYIALPWVCGAQQLGGTAPQALADGGLLPEEKQFERVTHLTVAALLTQVVDSRPAKPW